MPPATALRLPHLDLELTERCQLACGHCYINRPLQDACRAAELDTATWQRLLREAAALGTLSVRFTGGEPLVRADFAELYTFARRLGMTVQLYTNACALTPALAALFQRMPPLQPIAVTVYGMTAATCEAVTGVTGSFAAFQRGLALLHEYGVPFTVTFVVVPPNGHELPEFEAWANTLPDQQGPPVITTQLDLRVRHDDPAANQRIAALRLTPEARLAVLHRQPHYYQEMARFCQAFLGPPGDRLFTCGACEGGSIDSFGRLLPCLSVRHPDYTVDVREQPLQAGLQVLRQRLQAARATHDDYLARCARCFLPGLCEMCPGKSWLEHGTLDTPVDYYCAHAHAQARDLGLLTAAEHAWDVPNAAERVARLQTKELPT